MKGFLKYFIVMVLLIGALWSNDRPAQYGTIYNSTLSKEWSYIQRDFKSFKRQLVPLKDMIKFIDNLPVE